MRARPPPSRSNPWKGEAPAEPLNLGGRGFRRAGQLGRARLPPSRSNPGRARLPPSRLTWEGEAPAEPVNPGRARLLPSRLTLGGRGSCRAAGGNQRVLLWCLGGLISPRKDTENTEKRRGEGCAVCVCRPWEGEAPAEPRESVARPAVPSRLTWEGEAPAEPRVETNGCYCSVWVD